jgi:hypothetical protein
MPQPKRVNSRTVSLLFRRLFLQGLQKAFDAGKLRFFGDLADLAEAAAFTARLDELRRINWVVYAKPPFGTPNRCWPISAAHPSRGHRQPPANRAQRRQGQLHLEGLPAARSKRNT